IHIEIDEVTLGRTRIAISPLWETVASLRLLGGDAATCWPYSVWAKTVRRELVRRPGADLVTWFPQTQHRLPGFLTPIPSGTRSTFSEELARLTQEAGAALAGTPWLVDTLGDVWQTAVAPHWSGIRSALNQEVHVRSQVLATEGSGALLSTLPGCVRWEQPRLSVTTSNRTITAHCARSLVVVPLVFGRGAPLYLSDGSGNIAISYQARGAAVIGGRAPTEASRHGARHHREDRLAVLLGSGRAAVLRGL